MQENRHLNLLREFSVPLIMGVGVALCWANLHHPSYEWVVHTPLVGTLNLHFLTNDLFMALFFGIAAAEITESCLPGGDLNPPSKAVNALVATAGGVIGPAAVYLILNAFFGSPPLANGWGIPTATDIALAWLVARSVFGRNHPAVAFLLLLAIADDAIGLVIIALFYPSPHAPPDPIWLLLLVCGMLFCWLLRKGGVRSYWPYIVGGGAASWAGLYLAHLHPALALAFVVPFLPHAPRQEGHLFEEESAPHSPLDRFVQDWRLCVDFGMFFFGIVNAGVSVAGLGLTTWFVLAGLLLGKTGGVYLFSIAASRLGWKAPRGMGAREVLLAGFIAAIGFTVSLFIAGEAFVDEGLRDGAKMGALLSVVVAVPAVVAGKILKVHRRN